MRSICGLGIGEQQQALTNLNYKIIDFSQWLIGKPICLKTIQCAIIYRP